MFLSRASFQTLRGMALLRLRDSKKKARPGGARLALLPITRAAALRDVVQAAPGTVGNPATTHRSQSNKTSIEIAADSVATRRSDHGC